MRIFVALYCTQSATDTLQSLQKFVQPYDLIARAVKREQLHLTLAFYKSLDENGIQRLCEILNNQLIPEKLSGESFVKIGPKGESLALEIKKTHPLANLKEASETNNKGSKKHFRPHITLFRNYRQTRVPPKPIESHLILRVDHLAVVRSTLTDQGANHEKLHIIY